MTDSTPNPDDATDVIPLGATPMRRPLAVSYLRVSTKEQAERDGDPEGYSIPAQREANRRKAETIGADVIAEFVDRGESARSADRPELQRMLEFIRDQPVTYCIVHKVDRLARNRRDDVTINFALQKAGVRLVSATENIDETPSGMLLHGIMSSIAEFYSRNLANEVVKGMQQKAKTGGTPGRAPIGYKNVAAINEEGREVRTIVVDEQRAELITWAFETYATGEVTVLQLIEDLTARGFSTPATPTRASKPISDSLLYKVLTNPYYKGEVSFQGASYPGRHPKLVDDKTWQAVQDVLASRVNGERARVHNHYLKGTVYCGSCESRLVVQHAKNRHGVIYEYFVCVGRHQKRTDCQQKAVSIALIEKKIVELYRSMALSPTVAAQTHEVLRGQLERASEEAKNAQSDLIREQQRLMARSEKLLDSHLDDTIPPALYKAEQRKISAQLVTIEDKLDRLKGRFDQIERNLEDALVLSRDCYEAYRRAPDQLRRQYNQAFFTRILVFADGTTDADQADPFKSVMRASREIASRGATEGAPDNENPPNTPFQRAGGSYKDDLVDPGGFEPPTFSLRTRRATNCAMGPSRQRLYHPVTGGSDHPIAPAQTAVRRRRSTRSRSPIPGSAASTMPMRA